MTASDPNLPASGSAASWVARWYGPARALLIVFYLGVFLYVMVSTLHWPLVWDATVFHYINFLTAHGMTPYRDIFDMNMPGAYMLDNLQMHVFGRGDLAWRCYEYFLLVTLAVAMAIIAWPVDWLAGLVAAVLFTLVHLQGGPQMAGQRDELIAVLLMLGYGAVYQGVRRERPWLFFFYGLFLAIAISVKPTFLPLFCVLTLLALYVLKRQRTNVLSYALFSLAGVALPAFAVFAYLAHYHATADLLDLSRRLTTYYAGLMQRPIPVLLATVVPRKILPLVLIGLVLVLADLRNHPTLKQAWERWALWLGAAAGAFSYIAQRKGYDYHRYPVEAFLLLAFTVECARVLHARRRNPAWIAALAACALLYTTLFVVPRNVYVIPRGSKISDALFMRQLATDLTHLGGPALQNQVQCLDMVDGCLGALYHLNLVQNTGFTGDTLFFVKDNPPPVAYYRKIFWDDIHARPPEVMVVSDEWFNWERGFGKLDHWPAFAQFLDQRYTLLLTRRFPYTAYRIYVLKGARLLPLPQEPAPTS